MLDNILGGDATKMDVLAPYAVAPNVPWDILAC